MAHNIISTGLNTGNTIFNSNGGTLISGDAVKGGYFVTDTLDNIPSWSCVPGTLCYCTEDSKFYQYNGTTWVEKVFGITTNASESAAGLMSSDDKKKLSGIEAGANKITVDAALDKDSTNPVQNKVIYNKLSDVYTINQIDEKFKTVPILEGGLIPTTYLPSYVDDVIEVADHPSLPTNGERGKIYITLDDNKTYRWTGSTYLEIFTSDAEKNQNAFSKINVENQQSVEADNATDELTFEGENVSITTNAANDKITFKVDEASTSVRGIVKLSDSVKSDSTSDAATSNAVRLAYELADSKVANLTDLEITATASELNVLDGITATTDELNKLQGLTASTAELNFVDGVTSSIQAQLDNKLNKEDYKVPSWVESQTDKPTLADFDEDDDHQLVTKAEKESWNDKYTKKEIDDSFAAAMEMVPVLDDSEKIPDTYLPETVTAHISDSNIHVTTTDKALWADKYTKKEIDDYVFITEADIDAICGTTIQNANNEDITF